MSLSISPVSAIDVLNSASPQQGPAAGLAEKFASLMSRTPETTASEAGAEPSLGQVLLRQDEAMRKSLQDMHALAKAGTSTDMTETQMTARQIELTYEITTVQFQFNAGVHLAQSSKNGLQTLMRNQ
jgi:type III secretion inner rod protein HrpB2